MADPTRPRPLVKLKPGAAQPDARRKPLRPGAPHRPAPDREAPIRERQPAPPPGTADRVRPFAEPRSGAAQRPPTQRLEPQQRNPVAAPPARGPQRTARSQADTPGRAGRVADGTAGPGGPAGSTESRAPNERPPRPVRTAQPTVHPADHPGGIRIAKLMTERGLCSRREADEWIEAGWVRVGGQMAVLGQRAALDAVIQIDPRASHEQAQRMTVLLHKPMGIVSGQAEDGYEPAVKLVLPANRWVGDESGVQFHPGHLRHLAPAGRLDIDSTGLLVFTQDGRVAKRLIGDETRVEKEYLVRVRHLKEGPVPDSALDLLRHGLVLDDVQLRPARVSWQNEDQLRIVLREGRKRQIRRMCELVGLGVLGLKRVRIGSVALGPLPAGQWRYLRADERF